MQRLSTGMWLATIAAVGLSFVGLLPGEPTPRGEVSTPDALVRAALRLELDGTSQRRKDLLDQALARDPDFAPARWQSRYLQWDGRWLRAEDVSRRAKNDSQLIAYRKLRDELSDTADGHRELARWCQRHKLTNEARLHWMKVLEFGQDDEALAALKLQLYNGQLLTPQQVQQEKRKAGDHRAAIDHWHPQITRWRTAILQGDARRVEEARAQLKQLADPDAIPALEMMFGRAEKNNELQMLLVETVGRMSGPEATQVLLRRAVNSTSPEVRQAAIDAVKSRSLYTVVPFLLSAILVNVETRFEIYVLPDGTVVHDHVIGIHRGLEDNYVYFENQFRPIRPQTPATIETKVAFALRQAAATERTAEQARATAEGVNGRIESVLAQVMNMPDANDPRVWYQRWQDYTESYQLPDTPRSTRSEFYNTVRYMSCFPAGTPIATLGGPRPIEQIKAGDRVLAQHPQTGELAYKIVQGVTLRPPAPLVKIGLGSETLCATRGHPFWVNGRGWLMAKQLKVGMVLHSPNGAVVIDSLGESPAAGAYNLVVSDFDTYFVGRGQILVHDNLPLQETTALVPGLTAASLPTVP